MNAQELRQFLQKLASGEHTNEEYARFADWVENCSREEYQQMLAIWETLVDSRETFDAVDPELIASIEHSLDKIDKRKEKPVVRLWPRIAVAASVLLVLSIGGYFILHKVNNSPLTAHNSQQDVAPYTAKAILKTGQGKIILLDPAKNGLLASQGNVNVTKTATGQIAYTSTQEQTVTVYDTIQVPAGGRPYQVKLSDGSKILLSAATQLRFPESFSVDKREMVELISGEIYAEIVHNEKAPLQVKAPNQLITDIGTEFDISAYPDEPESRTTLVEGAIDVKAHSTTKVLKPGQQSILTVDGLTVVPADIEQATAWKNGDFSFNGDHIDVIMRQLARWYNIEVKYEGKMTNEVFYGKVTRKRNISEVLKMLGKTQKIHFKVEGRRVTVLNKS